ncbi:hypothetical protein Taro_013193 [Colocasia esculenta]|uniref:Uncharacterized protein n=1 Tax=Colocasia esculenta TaxID=4460 RepID=A0A843U5Y0_COLES|nr:hypothetical protein [Colocasia esculenta]
MANTRWLPLQDRDAHDQRRRFGRVAKDSRLAGAAPSALLSGLPPPPPPHLLFFLLLLSARSQGSQFLVCNSRDNDTLNASSNPPETRVVALQLGKLGLEGAVGWKALLGLDELKVLNLSQNSLGGGVSPELFRLRQLEVLDLSSNRLHGPIPDAFDGLRKLRWFSGRSNRFNGSLPASLSFCSMLTSLDLGKNFLTGRIGWLNFTTLPRLRTLRLDSNGFVGRIPRALSSRKELETLNLAKNQLRGRVPWSFKNLQALSSLSLASNTLSNVSQALKALSQCRNLTVLVLSANFFGETLSEDRIAGFKSLKALVIANCRLSGSVPSWVRRCAELRLLDLSSNRLGVAIPQWLGDLVHLFYVDLSNNSFVEVIPEALASLISLRSPNVSSTDNSAIEFPFHSRHDRSTEVQYMRFFLIPPTLDLSCNHMNGPILKGFGKLMGLTVLNLSNNNFSGSIPEELSGMLRLESLDLSHNNLSGKIPPSLDNLTFLSEFSVAYNHLEGLVPQSRQFLTFSCLSYEGNPGLYGGPLQSCPALWPGSTDAMEERFRITFMPLPYGLGVVIGFVPTVVCGSYCAYRRRRKKERRD